MKPTHRYIVALCALLPIVLCLAGGLLQDGPFPLFPVIFAAIGSLLAAVAFWLLSAPAARLHLLATEVESKLTNEGEEPSALIDTFADQSEKHFDDTSMRVLRDVSQKLSVRRSQLRHNFDRLTQGIGNLADPARKAIAQLELATPDTKQLSDFTAAYTKLLNHLRLLRKRQNTFTTYLREHPHPLIISDNQFRILSGNVAAEKLFGLSGKQMQNLKVDQLFVGGNKLQTPGDPTEAKPTEFRTALAKIQKTPGIEVNTLVKTNHQELVPTSLSAHFDEFYFFGLRDARPHTLVTRNAKEQHRKWTVSKASDFAHTRISTAIDDARTQTRVLASIIKRLPQSAQALPALMKNIEALEKLGVTSSLLHWLAKAETQKLSYSEVQELKLSEIADSMKSRLKQLLEEYECELDVTDQGAWMFSDEEYVETVMLGMVYHAVMAQKSSPIKLYLKRNDSRGGDDTLSLVCVFESAELSPEFEKDVANPYRRHDSLLLAHDKAGSVLGLYLSSILASKLGGALEWENLSGGLCRITATLPCRPVMPEDADGFWSNEDQINATMGDFSLGAFEVPTGKATEGGTDDHAIVSLKTASTEADDTATSIAAVSETAVLSDALGDWRFGE